ncbi:MAG: hypothetical protein PHO01_11820 [Desulfotomaculaceae bacterium]|nr:hypothetical protein [Desulfotomaculaceae bacterium]
MSIIDMFVLIGQKCSFSTARHKEKLNMLLFFLLMVGLVLPAGCSRNYDPARENQLEQEMQYKPVTGAFYLNGRGTGSSYESFCRHLDEVQVLSPLWYYVLEDGSLKEEIDQDALKLARDSGIKVIPLLVLASNRSSIVLTSPETRKEVIAGKKG